MNKYLKKITDGRRKGVKYSHADLELCLAKVKKEITLHEVKDAKKLGSITATYTFLYNCSEQILRKQMAHEKLWEKCVFWIFKGLK